MERALASKTNVQSPVRQSSYVQRVNQSPTNPVLDLQRQIGNSAIQRFLQSREIQAKLAVGQPGDKYEQEADRVAEQVMRMPERGPTEEEVTPVQTSTLSRQITPLTQLKAEPKVKEEEEKTLPDKAVVQRVPLAARDDEENGKLARKAELGGDVKPEEEAKTVQARGEADSAFIQRRAKKDEEEEGEAPRPEPPIGQSKQAGAEAPEVTPATAADIGHLRGGGRPLPPAAREFFEPRFGTDFSQVRLHADSRAAQAARSINARAFTVGHDIGLATGQYSPDTDQGRQLLAHELTHVVQQRSGDGEGAEGVSKAKLLNRAVNPGAPAPATPKTPVGKPAPPGEEVAPGVMDLRGPTFDPPASVADFLAARKEGTVNVRLGKVAQGPITVRRSRDSYSARKQSVPLTHPLFARVGEALPGFAPSLIVSVDKGKVAGYVGLAAAEKIPGKGAFRSQLKQHPELLGLVGFRMDSVPEIEPNGLEGGSLHIGLKGVRITLGSAFGGQMNLAVKDETVTFDGSVDISVRGLATGKLDLQRSPEGLVTGKANVGLTLPKNITGSVDVAWDGQAITGEGKVGYQGEKLSGEVTLRLMEKERAAQLEQEKKAPPAETAAPAQAGKATAEPKAKAKKIDYVVFGEGDLTFAFNEWLNGTAHVIIDPKGFLTIIGKITPQKEFELFEQKDYVKPLFKVEARAAYGIPVVGNIFIFANVGMDAFAKLGPAKFYNIVVEGTYSTDPQKSKDFSIRGSLNVSAAAGLRLRGEAGAGLEILDHDIKAGAGVNGIAGIRGYAEATPIIGYREKGAEGEDKKGEFFIRGELEIAAQPFLGLSGDLFVELDSPWWSPAPDKKWIWPLGSKEWPIGGSFGIGASVDYVFGSKQFPSIEFKPVDFSAEKFMTDLYTDKAKPKSGEAGDQKGEWKEKNAKDAEPPKGEAKGETKPGQAPALPAPEGAAAKPAGGKQLGKPADPNARTAEGRTVKELQEEASKKGKKPAGAEAPKGAGTEESAKKEPAKEGHDKELQEGLAALEAVTQRYAKDGATKEEVVTGVKSVRRKFKVFKSIEAVDGGETWDYEYIASPAEKKKGAKKKSQATKPKGDGKDYQRIQSGKLLDLTAFVNPIGQQFPPRIVRPDYTSPRDRHGRTNAERAKTGLTAFFINDDFVELHHRKQGFFNHLDEHSHTFHQSVVDDPDYHPFADDPVYMSWRDEVAWYRGQIRPLDYIYNRIRRRYWQNRF